MTRTPTSLSILLGFLLAASATACDAQTQTGAIASTGQNGMARATPGPVRLYDGNWWTTISRQERYGFVVGFLDCYIHEYHGDGTFSKSYDRYTQLLTAQSSDSANRALLLSQLIDGLRDPVNERAKGLDSPVADITGGHDGLYWRQMSTNEGNREQVGYVEGYLHCHDELAPDRGRMFAKQPDEYRALISAWYKFDERADTMDAVRELERISTVLFKVRAEPK